MLVVLAACETVGGPVLFGGDVSGDNLVVADGLVYWTTHRKGGPIAVWRGAVNGGEPQRLWFGETGGAPKPGMVVRRGHVFWAGALEEDSLESGLFSVPIEGGDRNLLATFQTTSAGGIAADDDAVYAPAPSLIRLPLDGGPPTELVPETVRWIVRRDSGLYFTTVTRMLLRLDVETGSVEAVVPTTHDRFDLDAEAAYVGISSSIIKVPFDRTATETIPVGGTRDIVRGPDALYAITLDGLVRVPLNGEEPELLRASQQMRSIVLDGSSLYFAECACPAENTGTIGRIDVPGGL